MSEKLTIGFLPLVDACLPILAHEHGYAEEEGLELSFLRGRDTLPELVTTALRTV